MNSVHITITTMVGDTDTWMLILMLWQNRNETKLALFYTGCNLLDDAAKHKKEYVRMRNKIIVLKLFE